MQGKDCSCPIEHQRPASNNAWGPPLKKPRIEYSRGYLTLVERTPIYIVAATPAGDFFNGDLRLTSTCQLYTI